MFSAAGLGTPPFICKYLGYKFYYDDSTQIDCPPYFNQGVIAAPREIVSTMGETIFFEMEILKRMAGITHVSNQIALTMALCRHNIPWDTMLGRFNFGNVPYAQQLFPYDYEDIRIIHYINVMRKINADPDKDKIFLNEDSINCFIQIKGLKGADLIFQKYLKQIHNNILRV